MMAASDEPLLDALYQGAFDVAAFERALGLLMIRFNCPSAALLSIDATAPATSLILVAGLFVTAADRFVKEFSTVDPAPELVRLAVGLLRDLGLRA